MFFSKRQNKRLKAQQILARTSHQQSMDRVRRLEDRRAETRTALNVGVWVIPMDGAAPEISQAFIAVTRDVNSQGLSIITNRPLPTPEILVCFSGKPEARFLSAKVVNRKQLGQGWLQLGTEVTGVVEADEHPQLREFTGAVML